MQGMVVLSCWVLGALQGAILILVPEMMQQGQLSAWQLAMPLSFGTFIFMYCSGRWGKLLDIRATANKPIISVVRWLLLGVLFSQLSFVLLLQFSDFKGLSLVIVLCISRIFHGIFCSAIIPSAQLTLSRNDKKGDKLVWSSIATNVGRLTAPLLTFVPVDINYFSLWFIASITLSAAFLAWVSEDKAEKSIENNVSTLPSSVNKTPALFSLLTHPFLLSICISALLVSLFSAQLQFSLGPLLLSQFSDAQVASEMIASLLFTASASALMSLFLLYRPLSRFPRMFLLTIVSSFIVGSCLFVMQQQLLLAVGLISSALSMAPVWYTALAMHQSKNNKARTSALVSQGHTLGNAFGGLVGGLLLVLGPQVLLLSFIILMIFILCSWLWVYRQSIGSQHHLLQRIHCNKES